MRDTFRAYRATLGIGFTAAPWHATAQWLMGTVMALAFPALAYGGKLLTDAVIDGDRAAGLTAAAVLAGLFGVLLVNVFFYVDCVFAVLERSSAVAERRLAGLMGGTHGLAHFERPEYLDQAHRIREERRLLSQAVNQTAQVGRALVALIATGVLLAVIHPVLLLLPTIAVLSFWLGKRANDLDIAAQEATSESERLRRHLFDTATATDSGKELRVFGLAEVLRGRHHAAADTVLRRRNQASMRGALLRGVDGLVAALAFIGAITLVLVMAVDGRATAGDVVLVVGLAARMSDTVHSLILSGTMFLKMLRLAKRFLWLSDYARRAKRQVADPVPLPDRLRHGIALSGVGFDYPGCRRSVLDDVSIRLPAGSVVALVGDNGAGKTTLVKLLSDFYRPDRGAITIDGVDLADIDPDAWRGRIGAAYQDFAKLEFRAHETVGVGDLPRIDDRRAVGAALDRAGAAGVVAELPRGLSTRLGTTWQDGTDLSGGQWQKLALGRGLMREDPLLVVFDEPTAALDPQTEHALFERFAAAARAGRERGTVTLLVSHRFSTVAMADLIVVLSGGRVAESGGHDELIAAGGLYAELYELQSAAYR